MFKKESAFGGYRNSRGYAGSLWRIGSPVMGLMRKSRAAALEGVDGVVGIGGDKDAGVDIHKAGAKLDAVEAGHVDIEE